MDKNIPIVHYEGDERKIIGEGFLDEDGIFKGRITDLEWQKKLSSDHLKYLSIEGE